MAKTDNKGTENIILEAAKKVFQRKGMDGSRMQEIADEAGINKALLHYYYRSKQLLFEAVFRNAFMLIAPQLNGIMNNDESIEDKIRSFTANYVSFMNKQPYLPRFVIQELNRNPEFILSLREKTGFPNLDKFKIQVADEVEKGLIRAISAEQLFINIVSLSIFPYVASPLIKAFGHIDDQAFAALMDDRKTEVADFIIHSIKPLQ